MQGVVLLAKRCRRIPARRRRGVSGTNLHYAQERVVAIGPLAEGLDRDAHQLRAESRRCLGAGSQFGLDDTANHAPALWMVPFAVIDPHWLAMHDMVGDPVQRD